MLLRIHRSHSEEKNLICIQFSLRGPFVENKPQNLTYLMAVLGTGVLRISAVVTGIFKDVARSQHTNKIQSYLIFFCFRTCQMLYSSYFDEKKCFSTGQVHLLELVWVTRPPHKRKFCFGTGHKFQNGLTTSSEVPLYKGSDDHSSKFALRI